MQQQAKTFDDWRTGCGPIRHREFGMQPGWISVPLVVTSHTWDNAKNERSHQDPTIGEALLGEMSDTARVLFPVDANSAVAAAAPLIGKDRADLLRPSEVAAVALRGNPADVLSFNAKG